MLGTITLFTGTMQALKQEQTKRLLAFHSIGQIGYILLGTGVCLALLPRERQGCDARRDGVLRRPVPRPQPWPVQGLLFLNAGSMLYATGTQNLNKMGGMMKFMPVTAITAMVASFSISGVPLFNGFVSKWMHLRGGGPGQPVGQIPGAVRRHSHFDQRPDAGFVHQVLRRELPVAHQRAGGGTGGQ